MNLLQYHSDDGELVKLSVDEVAMMIADQTKKSEISDFIYKRHYHRYIKPFEYRSGTMIKSKITGKLTDKYSLLYKNGFSLMANCCLLIETIESFYRGWPNSRSQSELAFFKFFTRDKNFRKFSYDDMPTEFYKNIRCGILHQGETTGGWSITRTGRNILDKERKVINATMFSKSLDVTLKNYQKELDDSDWSSLIWINARKKIKSIIKSTKK